MAAAVVRLYQETGTSGSTTTTNIDNGASGTNPNFGADDSVQSSAPVQIPTATGTNFAYFKNLYLNVTTAGTTSISNRQISIASSPTLATGYKLWYKANSSAYVQGSAPTAGGSNGATPTGYTALTTTASQYDNTSGSTASTGKNGAYVQVTFGVDNSYTGGPGSVTNPTIQLSYDEA